MGVFMQNLAKALVEAQKNFGHAQKNKTNPYFKSSYADLATCLDCVLDALHEQGIFLYQKTLDSEKGIRIETIFLHESGESLNCGVLHFPSIKEDPQSYASALTYARRYALMTSCGIAAAEEDDDGMKASSLSSNSDALSFPKASPLQIAELKKVFSQLNLGTSEAQMLLESAKVKKIEDMTAHQIQGYIDTLKKRLPQNAA